MCDPTTKSKDENDELFLEGVISTNAAAKFLSVSRSMVYLLMDQGALPFVKIGKARRIPMRAVVNLLRSCSIVLPPR
jgi:excisionase family DNA binding protein